MDGSLFESIPLWLVLAALLVNPAAAGEFTGRVVGVTDGDTIKVLHDDRAEIVRLVGVDAPEKRQEAEMLLDPASRLGDDDVYVR